MNSFGIQRCFCCKHKPHSPSTSLFIQRHWFLLFAPLFPRRIFWDFQNCYENPPPHPQEPPPISSLKFGTRGGTFHYKTLAGRTSHPLPQAGAKMGNNNPHFAKNYSSNPITCSKWWILLRERKMDFNSDQWPWLFWLRLLSCVCFEIANDFKIYLNTDKFERILWMDLKDVERVKIIWEKTIKCDKVLSRPPFRVIFEFCRKL